MQLFLQKNNATMRLQMQEQGVNKKNYTGFSQKEKALGFITFDYVLSLPLLMTYINL